MIALYSSFIQSGLQNSVQSCKYKWAILSVILLFSLSLAIGDVCYNTDLVQQYGFQQFHDDGYYGMGI